MRVTRKDDAESAMDSVCGCIQLCSDGGQNDYRPEWDEKALFILQRIFIDGSVCVKELMNTKLSHFAVAFHVLCFLYSRFVKCAACNA